MDLESEIADLARRARAASRGVGDLSSRVKDAWLLRAAERLAAARDRIQDANAKDLAEAEAKGIPAPMLRRLDLDRDKWRDMLQGLRDVAAFPDPVGGGAAVRGG